MTLADTSPSGPAGDGSRILVVEHEPAVAELERLYLSRAGFEVTAEADPDRAVVLAGRLRPDAVVLDLTGPAAATAEDHGAALFRKMAQAVDPAPVICLIGDATASAGLEGEGAREDVERPGRHWIRRPFSPRLLVAVVTDALRGRSAPEPPDVLRAGTVTLDPQNRSVRVGERAVALTATEFDLLAFLMRSPGRVYTREQLLDAAWGPAASAGARTVDVHIAQLRAKLGEASPLRTVRGVGYAVDG